MRRGTKHNDSLLCCNPKRLGSKSAIKSKKAENYLVKQNKTKKKKNTLVPEVPQIGNRALFGVYNCPGCPFFVVVGRWLGQAGRKWRGSW